ncbi:MAG: bifunctional phosphopantothenoylcysteine decarboxylase/phosphopantothenate--cysteine ligase CoaBC, partial [Alphaproteobacteria bacterium]
FTTPLALQAVSGEPVGTDLFDLGQESRIGHVALADEADVVLVAPATANLVAKLASGIADDLLTTVLVATRAPIVLAPAMNVNMLANPVVEENLRVLAGRGHRVVEPDEGLLACGYEGRGRMPDPPVLVEEVKAALAPDDLAGERVLVTAGPTREFLDPVRFLSNRSSGKMGFEVARAARRRGAEVVLVAGPTALPPPRGVRTIDVVSAEEMARAVRDHLADRTVVVAAAAVADWRPVVRAATKPAKTKGCTAIEVESTIDVLGTLVRPRPDTIVVGFAAETHDVDEHARGKLVRKQLDLVVANDVTAPGAGFDVDTNVVSILDASGAERLPVLPKEEVAEAILDRRPRWSAETSAELATLTPGAPRQAVLPLVVEDVLGAGVEGILLIGTGSAGPAEAVREEIG